MKVDIGILPKLEFDVNCADPCCDAWVEAEALVISEGVVEITLPDGWGVEIRRDDYKPSSKVVLEMCCRDHYEDPERSTTAI